MITKEILEKKIQEYKAVAEQQKANAIANIGAAQALELLLKEFDQEAKP